MRRRAAALAIGVSASALLAGCGAKPGGQGDLRAFVADVRARPGQAVDPVPAIVGYEPYTYHALGRRSPFTPDMPHSAPATDSRSALAPDPGRKPDPLERFPLDALTMVGTITSDGVVYALVRAPDQVIYRAARGDHMGQNFGAVRSVSNTGIRLTEIVPDGQGGYDQRAASLTPSG